MFAIYFIVFILVLIDLLRNLYHNEPQWAAIDLCLIAGWLMAVWGTK